MSVTRQQVVEEALSWIGTPFVHNQSVKGIGADCRGVVSGVVQELRLYAGVSFPPYTMNPDPRLMREELHKHLDEIGFKALRPADVVWFRVAREPQHLGVIVKMDPLTMVHAVNGQTRREVIETVLRPPWNQRVIGCFRYRGLED